MENNKVKIQKGWLVEPTISLMAQYRKKMLKKRKRVVPTGVSFMAEYPENLMEKRKRNKPFEVTKDYPKHSNETENPKEETFFDHSIRLANHNPQTVEIAISDESADGRSELIQEDDTLFNHPSQLANGNSQNS